VNKEYNEFLGEKAVVKAQNIVKHSGCKAISASVDANAFKHRTFSQANSVSSFDVNGLKRTKF
jgi:hypothetical protein